MTEARAHRASVRWSSEQEAVGLPHAMTTTDPAWFANETPRADEAWSLVCEFDQPPVEQGNPSTGMVHYLMAEAPHAKLVTGAMLQLFERSTGRFAALEILD